MFRRRRCSTQTRVLAHSFFFLLLFCAQIGSKLGVMHRRRATQLRKPATECNNARQRAGPWHLRCSTNDALQHSLHQQLKYAVLLESRRRRRQPSRRSKHINPTATNVHPAPAPHISTTAPCPPTTCWPWPWPPTPAAARGVSRIALARAHASHVTHLVPLHAVLGAAPRHPATTT